MPVVKDRSEGVGGDDQNGDAKLASEANGQSDASQNPSTDNGQPIRSYSEKSNDSSTPLIEDANVTNSEDIPQPSKADVKTLHEVLESLSQKDHVSVGTPCPCDTAVPLSLVSDVGLNVLSTDDDFHAAPKTVILPAVTGSATRGSSPGSKSPGSVGRRFTVNPVHVLPGKKHSNHTSRASTPASHIADHPPEVRFKTSNASIHKTVHADMGHPLFDTQISEEFGLDEKNLDDLFLEVDENQKTIQSVGGISNLSVDTQDSATFETSPLQCGNISFIRDALDSQAYQPKKHYVSVPADITPDQVTRFMSRYWALHNPKIVLSVISDVENFKPWKNQRLKDDFEKGIIKAANTTNTWIITNGLDGGIPKLIGDAFRQEKIQQLNSELTSTAFGSSSELHRKRLTLIGIVPKAAVGYGVFFDGTDGVQIKNVGRKPDIDAYELNPDHTHFIMVEDEIKDAQLPSMRYAIEKQLQVKHGRHKQKLIRLMSLEADFDGMCSEAADNTENTIPVVGLLVQGSPRNIDHVLYYLQNKMPIVVLKGSGGIADVIAFTYEEMMDRGDDLDYQENFLKPELIKFLTKLYGSQFEENDPAKLQLRDKIIECAKIAIESSGEQANMTVVNIKGWGSSLKDLDKFILMALFKSENHEGKWHDQLQSDLHLTVDWNRPDLAAEIFQQDFARARVDKHMFEQSLLKKDREKLIDLFLSQGVRVHKFLNHKKLKLLFEKAEEKEFFLNVCMEQVLGLTRFPDQQLEASFLSEDLNRLIYKLTRITNFINPYELSMCSTKMYDGDQQVAERRALTSLVIWAVLMNRHKLAKTLWTKCDEPICIALVCSMICHELSKYTMEQFQKTEIQNNAREYGEMALGILAICWQDSSLLAYSMLSKRHEDYNNKTVVEIAYDAEYIHFLAHPCCQKWLTRTFFGNMQVKELHWGLFRLPYWFKILASVFLIIPMYVWIKFIPPKKTTVTDEELEDGQEADEEEFSDEEDAGDGLLGRTKSAFEMVFRKRKENIGKRILRRFSSEKEKDVPFWQKIYLLWTAPITKFWMAQTFYFMYLAIFCFATLWPTCGHFHLDLTLWLWTTIILLELICRVYMKYQRHKALPLVSNCIEIFLILVFLVALLLTRIIQTWVSLTNYIHAKTIMCLGLIYFFYRLLGTYLLVSPTLGPMLHRINRMIKHDFVAFIRMFLIFMIAGGVTIQAIIYPNWPLDIDLIKRVITRPIYAMFLTQVTDLDGDPTCSPLYQNSSGYCASRSYVQGELEKCPRSSFPAYIITIQYLLICKLVLVTLLFAMFSLTNAKVDKEASQIWKFQRYALIADLLERFSLPPPFTVLSILYLFLQFVCKKCQILLCGCCTEKALESKNQKSRIRKSAHDDSNFWKQCAREFMANSQAEKEKQRMPEKHGEILISLTEDLRVHRKSMKRLADRVVELDHMVKSNRLYLEDIAHKLDKTDVQGITDVKGQFIHIAARQSPYPGTSIARFPVFDKYVPWELPYDVYDPKTYTLVKNNFPDNELSCVDEDILDLQKQRDQRALMTEDELNGLPPLPVFKPTWNAVITYKEKGVRREVDRRSWIDKDNKPVRYSLDTLGVPINPMGRTGIRGKGALWRWGPNHVIKAVITRWRRKMTPELLPTSQYLYVEGKRVLEFISVAIKEEFFQDISEASYGLPGDVLHGDSNSYSILCRAFKTYVLDQSEPEQLERFDQTDMIQYFAQFAASTVGLSSSQTSLPNNDGTFLRSISTVHPISSEPRTVYTDNDEQGFSASLLYKGYLDDPRNTDNAWVETEVWNFHYDLGDDLDKRLKGENEVKWKEVSPYVKMFGNESVIVQEAAKIHDAYH